MSVNEGSRGDNYSACAACSEWVEDQVLKRVGDDLLCRECLPELINAHIVVAERMVNILRQSAEG